MTLVQTDANAAFDGFHDFLVALRDEVFAFRRPVAYDCPGQPNRGPGTRREFLCADLAKMNQVDVERLSPTKPQRRRSR